MMAESPDVKRAKMETASSTVADVIHCKFFVKRKKRYCRLTPAKGGIYCGEHTPVTEILPETTDTAKHKIRVPCPLDPKHTIRAWKLRRHLKTCNALVKDQPIYIKPGLNAGKDADTIEAVTETECKLTDIDKEIVDSIVEKVTKLYDINRIDERIDELTASHPLLSSELNNKDYGNETLRHLVQTSTILGYLEHFKLFDDHISYVEYGAGKGQVSYWLAQAITNYPNSNVLLIDRASVRHKKDNKLNESHAVQRIRADIADFDISAHSLIQNSQRIVGIGKHLCGAATDFAIKCSINGNNVIKDDDNGAKTVAILIALCCHHRCEWKHFVGKEFFIQNDVTPKEFAIITKMVGWAICGSGMSRKKRQQIEEQPKYTHEHNDQPSKDSTKRDQHLRKEIGQKCKRLIDYARICYMEQNGYKCSLKRYVSAGITLENICLVATHDKNQ